MGMGGIFVLALILFAMIYFAVRLAINPLLHSQEEFIADNRDFGLIKLRDMDILNNTELEEVIKLFENNKEKDKDPEDYEKYAQILKEIKEKGYFNEEQYDDRINKLKNYKGSNG